MRVVPIVCFVACVAGACGGTVDAEVGRIGAGGSAGKATGGGGSSSVDAGNPSAGGSAGSTRGSAGAATGGTGGAGTGGTAGSGAGGKSQGTCLGFPQVGPTLSVSLDGPDDKTHQRTPALTRTSADGTNVGLVLRASKPSAISPPAGILQFAQIAPWDHWPSDSIIMKQGDEIPLSFMAPSNFFVDQGSTEGTLSIAYTKWQETMAPGESVPIVLLDSVNPSTGTTTSPALTIGNDSHLRQLPLFLRKTANAYLYGIAEMVDEPMTQYRAVVRDSAGNSTVTGCAATELSADAVQLPGGSIAVATTTDPDLAGGCPATPSSAVALASSISLRFGCYEINCAGGFQRILNEDASDGLEFVRLAPHPAGLWVVYRYLGLNAEVQPPAGVMLLDTHGNTLLGPKRVFADLGTSGVFAASSVSDWLVLAAAGTDAVRVALVDRNGASTETTIPLFADGQNVASGEITVVANAYHVFPEAIVGWSQYWSNDATSGVSAHLAKLECEHLADTPE